MFIDDKMNKGLEKQVEKGGCSKSNDCSRCHFVLSSFKFSSKQLRLGGQTETVKLAPKDNINFSNKLASENAS